MTEPTVDGFLTLPEAERVFVAELVQVFDATLVDRPPRDHLRPTPEARSVPAEERPGPALPERVLDAACPLAELLDELAHLIRRYVVLTVEQTDAIVLWVAHVWAIEAFDVTGYLAVLSPERRSGKTRLLDVLELLVPRPWRAIEPSEAVVYRKLDADMPTLLLDEVDAIFGRKRDSTEGLRALLNAGNARGTRVPRCVGASSSLVEFSVFGPKVLAGIGALPETVSDRSIVILMQRKTRSERCERFRRRRAVAETDGLRERLEAWAADGPDELEGALARVERLADDGEPLASLDDRAFEQAWEPLLAVADLAGAGWPGRAITAALKLSGGRDAEPEGMGVRLLGDIRTVFDRLEVDRLQSARLAAELAEDKDGPWADWYGKPVSPRTVADLLRPFDVRPKTIRFEDQVAKGYQREQFENPWTRYAPLNPASSGNTVTSRSTEQEE